MNERTPFILYLLWYMFHCKFGNILFMNKRTLQSFILFDTCSSASLATSCLSFFVLFCFVFCFCFFFLFLFFFVFCFLFFFFWFFVFVFCFCFLFFVFCFFFYFCFLFLFKWKSVWRGVTPSIHFHYWPRKHQCGSKVTVSASDALTLPPFFFYLCQFTLTRPNSHWFGFISAEMGTNTAEIATENANTVDSGWNGHWNRPKWAAAAILLLHVALWKEKKKKKKRRKKKMRRQKKKKWIEEE